MPDLVGTRFGPLDRELSRVALHAIAIVACDGVRALDRAVEALHGNQDSPTYQEPPSVRWNDMLTGFLPGACLVIDVSGSVRGGVARYAGALSGDDERTLRSFFAAAANFLLSEAMAVDEILELNVTWAPEHADAAQSVDDLVHTAITTSRALLDHSDAGTWRSLVCAPPPPQADPTAAEAASRRTVAKRLAISVGSVADRDDGSFLYWLRRALQHACWEAPGTQLQVYVDSVAALPDKELSALVDQFTNIADIRWGGSAPLGGPRGFHTLRNLLHDATRTVGRPDMLFVHFPRWGTDKRPPPWPSDLLTGVSVTMTCAAPWRPMWNQRLSRAGAGPVSFLDDRNPDDVHRSPVRWPLATDSWSPVDQLVRLAPVKPDAVRDRGVLVRAAAAAALLLVIAAFAYLLAGTQHATATTILVSAAVGGGMTLLTHAVPHFTSTRKLRDGHPAEPHETADRSRDLYEVTPAVMTAGPESPTYEGFFARAIPPPSHGHPFSTGKTAQVAAEVAATPAGAIATAPPRKTVWRRW